VKRVEVNVIINRSSALPCMSLNFSKFTMKSQNCEGVLIALHSVYHTEKLFEWGWAVYTQKK